MNFDRSHSLYQEDLEIISGSFDWEKLKGKSIAIIGASGLIGTLIVDALIYINIHKAADISITAIGRNLSKIQSRFAEYIKDNRINVVIHDVFESFLDSLPVDFIINCAGNSHPALFARYPVETFLANVKGAENLLKWSVKSDATLLFISSGEIYGENTSGHRMDEEFTGKLSLDNPRSCYSEGKRGAESLCQAYMAQYDAKVKIARPCRIFGPTMTESDNKASAQFLKAAKLGNDIILKSSGNQLFSYIYGADAVSALLTILVDGEIGVPYNIANANSEPSLKKYAELISHMSGVSLKFNLEGEKGGSLIQNALLDNTRLRQLGWDAHFGLEDAISRTLHIMNTPIYEN